MKKMFDNFIGLLIETLVLLQVGKGWGFLRSTNVHSTGLAADLLESSKMVSQMNKN